MPAKNKILKTFHLTRTQDAYLKKVGIKNLSEYIRALLAASLPDFPDDMPPAQHIRQYNASREK